MESFNFKTKNYSAKHTPYARILVYENVFAHTNSDSNILATVEKADQVDFLGKDGSTSAGFMKIKVDGLVPNNVRS